MQLIRMGDGLQEKLGDSHFDIQTLFILGKGRPSPSTFVHCLLFYLHLFCFASCWQFYPFYIALRTHLSNLKHLLSSHSLTFRADFFIASQSGKGASDELIIQLVKQC